MSQNENFSARGSWRLAYAYEQGDLSRVYPLARGAAPMIVMVVSIVALPDVVAFWEYAGVDENQNQDGIRFGVRSLHHGFKKSTTTAILAKASIHTTSNNSRIYSSWHGAERSLRNFLAASASKPVSIPCQKPVKT